MTENSKEIKYEYAPAGWEVIGTNRQGRSSGIIKQVGRSNSWIKANIAELLTNNPQWKTKKYLDIGGRPRDHYPPEIIAALKEQAELEQPAPPGWEVVGDYYKRKKYGISAILKRSKELVQGRIDVLLTEHPEWGAKSYLDNSGKIRDHYPPAMIAALKEQAELEQPAPPGWEVIGSVHGDQSYGISAIVGHFHRWIQRKIDELLIEHPEWKAKLYLDNAGILREHYPPAMIAALKEQAELEQPPPLGWKLVGGVYKNRRSGICKEVDRSRVWIEGKIDELLIEHPEWGAKPYLDKSGRLKSHFPPEMIKKLKRLSEEERKGEE